jgi:hypothetical protein
MKKIIILFFLAASCTTEPDQKTENVAASNVPASVNTDTLDISLTTAVMYEPDSGAIAKRKKEIGEENFLIGADDYLNYMHLSSEFFEKEKFNIIHAKTKNVLRFTLSNGSKNIIRLDTVPELWGVYLFSPGQHPKLIDMTVTEDEYKTYFKNGGEEKQ